MVPTDKLSVPVCANVRNGASHVTEAQLLRAIDQTQELVDEALSDTLALSDAPLLMATDPHPPTEGQPKRRLRWRGSWQQVTRYRFDNFMSRGGSSVFISLVVVFVGALLAISLVRGGMLVMAPGAALERGGGFFHNMYITFLQMTDPGNMNQDVESAFLFKVSAIASGLLGVVMLSTLVAFITTALDQKLCQLKKGHSKVIESGHTLILGWNERVTEILRELILANESEADPVVVILAEEDKEEMDDHIKMNLRDTMNTRIVTRSGSPSSLVNLDIASVSHCKSVIVLARCAISGTAQQKEASDAVVIKTVLALAASRDPDRALNIVVEMFSEGNRRIAADIAPGEISSVDTDEILAKILVQTSRSIGLSVVYGEVLSFDGCEMYFHDADWGNIRFGELAYRFPDGVPMGVRHGDGELILNPPVDLQVRDDDSVLILAEDDSTIHYQRRPVARPTRYELAGGRKLRATERNLIIGWTPKVETILREYADYVMEGSSVSVMLRHPNQDVRTRITELDAELAELDVSLIQGNPLTREGLLEINPSQFDNIIILSQGAADDDERTESETILILLLLRGILGQKSGETKTKLITEVLDSENQPLVARAGVHDFVISNRFVSMLLAQISEDADIQRVYDDLFDEDGSEIYLKPASLYFSEFPVTVSYADMIDIAQQREEVCLGVKIVALEHELESNFGVKLIPDKNQRFTLSAEDSLVVLAEDEL